MCLTELPVHTFLDPLENHEYHNRTYYIYDDICGIQAVSRIFRHIHEADIHCVTTMFITTGGPWYSGLAHYDLLR